MKTVLYFPANGKISARQKLQGIFGFGRVHGWDVQVIEPGASERKATDLIRFWEPDGVIVECGSEQNHFRPKIFGTVPVVFLDRNPKTLSEPSFCVTHDSEATAKIAARELLSLRLPAYAYVPWPEPRFWSNEREKGFSKALHLNGHGYIRFGGKARSSDVRSLQKELCAWIKELPRPVGVFAANDFMASQVIAAANRSKMSIPEDIAVIGVDNDELICENTNPTLSSVMPDFRSAGEMAAEMLERRMTKSKMRPITETFGPLDLIRRASTNRFKKVDREVLAALDLIRRESCNGLKARDVAACFSCSRRMAEIKFRAATGKSMLTAIQEVRRAKAQELLSDPSLDRTSIANLCGYSSATALMNLLRKTFEPASGLITKTDTYPYQCTDGSSEQRFP